MRQLHLSPQLSPSPVLSSHFSPPPAEASSWRRRLHRGRAFQPPLSSLRETNKATLRKATPNAPFRLGGGGGGSPKDRRPAADDKEDEDEGRGGAGALTGTLIAGALLVGFVGGFGAAGYVYKDQINTFLTQFSGFLDGNGLLELCSSARILLFPYACLSFPDDGVWGTSGFGLDQSQWTSLDWS